MGTKKKGGGGLLVAALLLVGAGGCGGDAVVPPQNAESVKKQCQGKFPCLGMLVILGSNKTISVPVENGGMTVSPIGGQPECLRAEKLEVQTLPAAVTYSFTKPANACSSAVGYDFSISFTTPFDGRKAEGGVRFLWSDLGAGGDYIYREVSLTSR